MTQCPPSFAQKNIPTAHCYRGTKTSSPVPTSQSFSTKRCSRLGVALGGEVTSVTSVPTGNRLQLEVVHKSTGIPVPLVGHEEHPVRRWCPGGHHRHGVLADCCAWGECGLCVHRNKLRVSPHWPCPVHCQPRLLSGLGLKLLCGSHDGQLCKPYLVQLALVHGCWQANYCDVEPFQLRVRL